MVVSITVEEVVSFPADDSSVVATRGLLVTHLLVRDRIAMDDNECLRISGNK